MMKNCDDHTAGCGPPHLLHHGSWHPAARQNVMVAWSFRADSSLEDRVEITQRTADGCPAWRMMYSHGELWIDVRLVATGLPTPFESLAFTFDAAETATVMIDENGAMVNLATFVTPDDLKAAIEIFCLVVAMKGGGGGD